MTMTLTIDDLLKAGEHHIRNILIGGKEELTPFVHLVRREDGQDILLMTPWRDATEKEITFRVLRSLLHDEQIVRYMLIHEGWMRKAEPGEFTPEQEAQIATGDFMPRVDPIAQHPKRREVVMAVAVEKGGKTIRMWEIKRDTHGNCSALVEVDTDADNWRGAALELLDT
jgi:hypothetical protein